MRPANNSVDPPSFPDDAGADYFIREYRTAVNPAPENSKEERIAADFASHANIVADTGKPEAPAACVPAEQAVIVQNSGDFYSKSLADKFRDSFGARKAGRPVPSLTRSAIGSRDT